MSEIFISYSRKDKDKVHAIVSDIEKTVGKKCWIDLQGIDSAEQFDDVIVEALSQAKVMLFIMSQNSMNSKFVKKEISFALNKGIRLVPVMIDNAEWTDWFIYQFGDLNCIQYTDSDQRVMLLRNLIQWCSVDMEVIRKEQEARAKKARKTHSTKPRWKVPTIIGGCAALIATLIVSFFFMSNKPTSEKVIVDDTPTSKIPATWVTSMEMRMTYILKNNSTQLDSLQMFHELDSLFQARFIEANETPPLYTSSLSDLREQRFHEWVNKGDKCVDKQVATECYIIALLIKEDPEIREKGDIQL